VEEPAVETEGPLRRGGEGVGEKLEKGLEIGSRWTA